MHIRLTSHGGLAFAALHRGPMGAAALPLRVARARLALEWLLVPTLAAGLCLPAAVCCSALPSAAFSVARVEVVRARRAQRGEGAPACGRRCGEARRRRMAPLQMLRRQRRRRGARRLLRSRA